MYDLFDYFVFVNISDNPKGNKKQCSQMVLRSGLWSVHLANKQSVHYMDPSWSAP